MDLEKFVLGTPIKNPDSNTLEEVNHHDVYRVAQDVKLPKKLVDPDSGMIYELTQWNEQINVGALYTVTATLIPRYRRKS